MQNTTRLLILWAFMTFVEVQVAGLGPLAGPYDVVIERIETCEDEGTGQIHFESKLNNAGNNKYTYNSNFSFLVPMDKDFKMYVDAQKWGNGGYKPRYIEYTMKNCEELWKYLKDFIKSLMLSAGVTINQCPIPEGNYTANNWEVDLTFNGIPVLKYDKYRLFLTFYYKEVKVGCEKVTLRIVPKKILG